MTCVQSVAETSHAATVLHSKTRYFKGMLQVRKEDGKIDHNSIVLCFSILLSSNIFYKPNYLYIHSFPHHFFYIIILLFNPLKIHFHLNYI